MSTAISLRPSEYAVFSERGAYEMHLRMHLPPGTVLVSRSGYEPERVVVTDGGRLKGVDENGRTWGRSYVILTITADDEPLSTRHTVTTQGSFGPGGRRHRSFEYGHEAVAYALKWLDRRYRLEKEGTTSS